MPKRKLSDFSFIRKLSKAKTRKVFYVDMTNTNKNLSYFKKQLKRKFKKDKFVKSKLDMRWNPLAQDEDIWIPTRSRARRSIEILPKKPRTKKRIKRSRR